MRAPALYMQMQIICKCGQYTRNVAKCQVFCAKSGSDYQYVGRVGLKVLHLTNLALSTRMCGPAYGLLFQTGWRSAPNCLWLDFSVRPEWSKGEAMPQLVKGGKWVFGWVTVGPEGELAVPPDAWIEYGFQPGEEAVFLPGSRTSGGFGLSTPRLMARMASPMQTRALARGRLGRDGQVKLPPQVGVQPGARLLAVRGSGRALGFVSRGPIYEEAQRHPAL